MESSTNARQENGAAYEEFVQYHRDQLLKSGVPERFWGTLHRKLQKDVSYLWFCIWDPLEL